MFHADRGRSLRDLAPDARLKFEQDLHVRVGEEASHIQSSCGLHAMMRRDAEPGIGFQVKS